MQSSREKTEAFIKRSTREQIVQRMYELSLALEWYIMEKRSLRIGEDILFGTATQGQVIELENKMEEL